MGVPLQHHSLSIRRRQDTLFALPKYSAASESICIVKLKKSPFSLPTFKTQSFKSKTSSRLQIKTDLSHQKDPESDPQLARLTSVQ